MKNCFNYLKAAVIYAALASIIIITLGVLALPVVMALTYSCCWLFLYLGYLVLALVVAAFCAGGNAK